MDSSELSNGFRHRILAHSFPQSFLLLKSTPHISTPPNFHLAPPPLIQSREYKCLLVIEAVREPRASTRFRVCHRQPRKEGRRQKQGTVSCSSHRSFPHVDVKAKRSGCSDVALTVCRNQAVSAGKANSGSLDHAKCSPEAVGCDSGVFYLEVLSNSCQWLSPCWGN